MSEKTKMKRSQSAKLLGILENKLKIERSISRDEGGETRGEEVDADSATPDVLPILRRSSTVKHTKETSAVIDGGVIPTSGRMRYEDMLTMLRCLHCAQVSSPPLVQCRKGHVYCKSCKTDNKIVQCSTCKQTFVDAPNVALDQLVRLIAIPCKYGSTGCCEYVFLDSRLQHETLCKYRPLPCQFERHGCTQVFPVKDMCWHHKMCKYANYPHPNVLPSMPTRKKGVKAGPGGGDDSSERVGGEVNGSTSPQPNPSVQVQTEIKLFPGILSRT